MTTTKKTVVIWNEVPDGPIRFFVHEGRDISHLNNKYVNLVDCSESETDEINAILYDSEWKEKVNFYKEFPINAVMQGADVIVMGFFL